MIEVILLVLNERAALPRVLRPIAAGFAGLVLDSGSSALRHPRYTMQESKLEFVRVWANEPGAINVAESTPYCETPDLDSLHELIPERSPGSPETLYTVSR